MSSRSSTSDNSTYVNGVYIVDRIGRVSSGANNVHADNPYSLQEYVDYDEPCVYRFAPGYPTSNSSAAHLVYTIPPDIPGNSNDVYKLYDKLDAAVRSHQFDAGAALGEGHETLKMIGDTAINLANMYRHLKRGNFHEAARAVGIKGRLDPKRYRNNAFERMGHQRYAGETRQMASEALLQMHFGWQPLLSDVYEGAKAVGALMARPENYSYKVGMKLNNTRIADWAYGRSFVYHSKKVNWKVVISSQPTANELLGLNDPAGVIWERLPFSCVADWVIPIGPMLKAATTRKSLAVNRVVISELEKSGCVGSTFPVSPHYASTAKMKKASVYFRRYLSSTLPSIPAPNVKPLSKALSVKHALDGIAILSVVGSGSGSSIYRRT